MEKLAYIATLDTILWRFALVFGLFIEFLQVCHVKYGRIKTFMQDNDKFLLGLFIAMRIKFFESIKAIYIVANFFAGLWDAS